MEVTHHIVSNNATTSGVADASALASDWNQGAVDKWTTGHGTPTLVCDRGQEGSGSKATG
jgi:hypothetical protein